MNSAVEDSARVDFLKNKHYRVNSACTKRSVIHGPSLFERLFAKLEDLVTSPSFGEKEPKVLIEKFLATGLYPRGISYRDAIAAVCQDMRLSHDETDRIIKMVHGR